MCARTSVSSQLTGVSESPEETAAQLCPPSLASSGRLARTDARLSCVAELQERARASWRLPTRWPRVWPGIAPCPASTWHEKLLDTCAHTHAHTSMSLSHHIYIPYIYIFFFFTPCFYFCFQTGFSSSAFSFKTPLLFFKLFSLYPTIDTRKGLNI